MIPLFQYPLVHIQRSPHNKYQTEGYKSLHFKFK
jgi:hypothetical protein